MQVRSNLDLAQSELRNAVTQNLSGAPSSPKAGQRYYNTGTNIEMVWNGTAWRPCDAAGLADGTIPIAALGTNPLARANHTGTQPSNTISDLATAILARSNHTGTQVAATISDLATTVQAYRLDQFAAPTTSVSFGSNRLINLTDPSGAQDAATKNYVDGAVQSAAAGIDSKPSVRAIATSNITLSAAQVVDGVSLVAGDRCLAAAQTTASQNGVYVVAAGAWTRALDADQTGEVTPGAFWFVEEGTSYGKTQWRCNNTGTITLGTTAINVVQFGAANLYSAGNGLSLTGTVYAVQLVASSGLVSTGSGLGIDTTVVARKFSGTITGDGTTTAFTVTHSLGTKDVHVQFRDSSDNFVLVDWVATSTSAITVTFATAPANAATYRAVVLG